jgi:hypothetical protein
VFVNKFGINKNTEELNTSVAKRREITEAKGKTDHWTAWQ